MQKITEKRSVANQLYDLGDMSLNRLNSDIKYVESLFQNSGEIKQIGFPKGQLVAVWIDNDGVCILARVAKQSFSIYESVLVTDIEDASSSFSLPAEKVKRLPTQETLQETKTRLHTRGRKVYAMYPDTTSFYKGTLVGLPTREANNSINNYILASSHANLYSSFLGAPYLTICQILFDDDADMVTGQTAKHSIPTMFVFSID